MFSYNLFMLLLCAGRLQAQTYEGDSCSYEGRPGTCSKINNCKPAQDGIRLGKLPQICSFSGREPVVCCVGAAPAAAPTTALPPRPVLTTSRPSSTTQYVPPVYDYMYEDPAAKVCPPIPANMTSQKTGQKAWDKCIEYQEVIYPCVKTVALALLDEKTRADHCGHQVVELVIGGVDTQEREFPHMVMLGYGTGLQSLQWLCGGTLISDRFVLTAGHCSYSRDFGEVTHVRTGALRRSQPVDAKRTYAVSEIIKHPQYKPPVKYNDITLLKTDRAMTLDQFAVPACLHVGNTGADDKALATGWGATQYKGANADVLQKVVLEKFTTSECVSKFPVGGERNMKQGFQESTQMCYGHHTDSKDTCQGDSGGPLQIFNRNVYCMYTVVGVTSFGKACGFAGNPGVYTRVAAYVPWIESVVWP